MKERIYIDKVLSRISDKSKKKYVREELYDHIDEKEHFFEEIGYDENVSIEKAADAMGDADIVGEQLDLIGKSFFKSNLFRYAFSVASLLLMIGAYVLLSTTDMGDMFSAAYVKYYYGINTFWSFCMFSFVFILGCVNLTTGIKRKSIIPLLIGFVICETIIIVGPYHYCDLLYCIANKTSFIENFFMQSAVLLMPSNIYYSGYAYIVSACAVIILLIFAAALTIIIKTSKLKNTKTDLKIKNSILIFTSVIAIGYTGIALSVTGLVISNNIRIYEKVNNEFVDIEREFIDNIDSFTTLDENKIDKALNRLIEKTNIPPRYEEAAHDSLDLTNGFMTIREEFEEYDNDDLAQYEISMYCSITNPFSFNSYNNYVYSQENGNSNSLDTVSLPAQLHFTYSEDESTIVLTYSFDDYFQKKTEYCYNFDKKEFELEYDLSVPFEAETTLSKNQTKLFITELKDSFYGLYDVEFNDKQTKFGSKGKYLWYETYGVYKSDIIDDIYKIDLSFTAYDILITSGVYEPISFNNGEPVLGVTFYVKFNDDKAELIDWYYPESDEYESTSKLISLVEEIFNKKSIENLKKSDPARRSNNELVHLKNKIREDYYNKYAY